MDYLAHRSPDGSRTQTVRDHLSGTAALAAEFAAPFGARDLGQLCGLLHDIGKYSLPFQRRIWGASIRVDHATAGAKEAFSTHRSVPAAFCIAGHHGGLPDGGNPRADTADDGTLFGKLARQAGREIPDYSAFHQEIAPMSAPPPPWCKDARSAAFFTRMLYSCLVDADFLDTERFMQDGGVLRGGYADLSTLNQRLQEKIAPWWAAATPLNQRRCDILRSLMDQGPSDRGLFSLTVPTGGGKTVASMAFALAHALAGGQRRVVYIIPYVSILEQTQSVFEGLFGAENVVAHCSTVTYTAADGEPQTDPRQLSAENWDAPIILTTAVQFFESLYANRSSRCRKLHNLADSVLIFDEAQMFPVPYLKPCLLAIAQLVEHYGCSAVLCTATQPALGPLLGELLPGAPIRELCPDWASQYRFFRRVQYRQEGLLSDDALAARLNAESQVLCIVNNRRQAQALFARLDPASRFHLSTTMTPAHRRAVLECVRQRLADGLPCHVVSTSLVEAGVDVDFPAVYRALAGLDSILQAGGRCNREGRRAAADSLVHVFETDQAPPPILRQNIAAARAILARYDDIAAPEAVRAYFQLLYHTLKGEEALDEKRILPELDRGTMAFATIASRFRLIDTAQNTLYIPCPESAPLLDALDRLGPSRTLLRKLEPYAVRVYPAQYQDFLAAHAAKAIAADAAILLDAALYDSSTGLAFGPDEGRGLLI